MVWARRTLTLLVGAGLVYGSWEFAASNAEPVEVNLLMGSLPELALWQTLAAAFAMGAALVGLFTVYRMARGGLVAPDD